MFVPHPIEVCQMAGEYTKDTLGRNSENATSSVKTENVRDAWKKKSNSLNFSDDDDEEEEDEEENREGEEEEEEEEE